MPTRVEDIRFNGIKYRRYPDAKKWSDRMYFRAGIGDRLRGFSNLHRDMWIAANGPIPDGHHIHHRDEKPLNNTLQNFECLPKKEHAQRHPITPEKRRGRGYAEHLAKIRPLSYNWHKTEAGREWHRRHGKEVFGNRIKSEKVCEQCGKPYEGEKLITGERFCSNACKSAWRREAGLDDVQRECARCGKAFASNKYEPTTFCSRECAAVGKYVRPTLEVTCTGCGKVFIAHSPKALFCSNACRKRHNRTKQS